jgi:hypothetical protein
VTYFFKVCRSSAIACKSSPYLADKDTPYLGFRLAAFCLCFLLEVEHSLAKGYKVGHEVGERRRMGLSEEGKQEGPWLVARLTINC